MIMERDELVSFVRSSGYRRGAARAVRVVAAAYDRAMYFFSIEKERQSSNFYVISRDLNLKFLYDKVFPRRSHASTRITRRYFEALYREGEEKEGRKRERE